MLREIEARRTPTRSSLSTGELRSQRKAKVFTTVQKSDLSLAKVVTLRCFRLRKQHFAQLRDELQIFSRPEKGDEQMLGIIAAVLIVLWLLGFFAFHVTSAFIHVVLVVAVIMLVLHFARRGTESD